MPVIIKRSFSQMVQDFTNAWLAANNDRLFMVDLVTGETISEVLVDMPALGFSTKLGLKAPIGFPVPDRPGTDDDKKPKALEIEGTFYLEFDRQSLPAELQKLEKDFWLIDIEKEEFLPIIKPLADALSEEFKIDIVIRPEAAKDNDPKHVTERLSTSGVIYCPIIPRTVPPQKDI